MTTQLQTQKNTRIQGGTVNTGSTGLASAWERDQEICCFDPDDLFRGRMTCAEYKRSQCIGEGPTYDNRFTPNNSNNVDTKESFRQQGDLPRGTYNMFKQQLDLDAYNRPTISSSQPRTNACGIDGPATCNREKANRGTKERYTPEEQAQRQLELQAALAQIQGQLAPGQGRRPRGRGRVLRPPIPHGGDGHGRGAMHNHLAGQPQSGSYKMIGQIPMCGDAGVRRDAAGNLIVHDPLGQLARCPGNTYEYKEANLATGQPELCCNVAGDCRAPNCNADEIYWQPTILADGSVDPNGAPTTQCCNPANSVGGVAGWNRTTKRWDGTCRPASNPPIVNPTL